MTKRAPPYSREIGKRVVPMVLDHQGEHGSQYAAIRSIAQKICCSGEPLRNWVLLACLGPARGKHGGQLVHAKESLACATTLSISSTRRRTP